MKKIRVSIVEDKQSEREFYAELLFESLKAGALGYLLKSDSPAKVLEAIEDVHAGRSAMSPVAARKICAYFAEIAATPNPLAKLSAQEMRTLELLAKGKTYKEIATSLSIATGTVRTYLSRIYGKLEVTSRGEATALYGRGRSR
ncbi:MAG: response regulator transcription factor [Verrucomicrobia bacterium]|nr:response regulator transcription factor [Verrucomicrobiota bacterium]